MNLINKNLKNLIATVFLTLFSILKSQVGIGTETPNSSSILDISSTNKGVLLPRVSLTSANDSSTITNPAEGLIVWNTNASSNLPTGITYYSGNKWNNYSSTSSNNPSNSNNTTTNWETNGNAGSEDNFIGTTDNVPLIVKVNNSQIEKFYPNGGVSIGLNSTTNQNKSVAIGFDANASASEAFAIGNDSKAQGYQSIGIGSNSNTVGMQSVAIGFSSAATGNQALSLGDQSSSSSNSSIAIGNLSTSSANQSIAIGTNAKATNGNAISIGNSASSDFYNSIVIGNSVSAKEDNAIVIGNDSNHVGIGTSTPNVNTKLDVNGNFKLGSKGTTQKNIISFNTSINFSLTTNLMLLTKSLFLQTNSLRMLLMIL